MKFDTVAAFDLNYVTKFQIGFDIGTVTKETGKIKFESYNVN